MKRGTPEHPKVAALCALLNIRKYEAVGILEMLWHFTAKYAPQGDIGRYNDKAIAAAVDWQRPTGTKGVTPECRLSDALVGAGWLDRHPVHRLVVHDWHDHADQTLRRLLASRKLAFASEKLADASLPLPVPLASCPLPAPAPIPALIPIRASPLPSEEIGAAAERMYGLHPKKADLPLVPDAVEGAVKTGTPLSDIEECHKAWCESEDWQKNGGRFAPKLATWLFDRGYTRWPPGHHRNLPANCGPRVEYYDTSKITGERA